MTLDPLWQAGPITAIHALLAIAAFVLGAVQLALPKGGARHRAMGRAWVALMLGAALSAPLIGGWTGWGDLSWLHGLVLLTVFGLWGGVRAARAGDRRDHARTMLMVFAGALVIAGGFAFAPGRVMHAVVTGGGG